MSGVAITIEADGESAVMQALARLSNFDQSKPKLFDAIGQMVVSNIRSRWTNGEGLEGKWRLSGRVRRKGGTTLRDTSRLMNSITHNVLQNGVEIGTDVEYGPIHHFGGDIHYEARMRRTYFRQNQRTGLVGNTFVRKARSNFMQESMGKAYKVNMPRRPFLGLTESDELEVMDLIVEHLTNDG
ncbi:phage morphogenesis protein [Acinetobacter bouvetii]|uniref:Phage morphogenesis protein n=2 Tax=Acinetobacter TaxID=469 RepID=A0A4Q7AUL8_9GAMM|nr:phage virion morphogenesis protein [Acinetobacter bouvetii]RZG64092.1 phage morphogenesis protein [Acinetobacter bouvetii]